MIPRLTACTPLTMPPSANMAFTAENSCLPMTPPMAAPRARGVPVDISTLLSPARRDLPTE